MGGHRGPSAGLGAPDLFGDGFPNGLSAMDWIRDRALTLAWMAMFLLFLVGQLVTGLAEYNSEQVQHGYIAVNMSDYLVTGHPSEALFENWESEFLQMAAYVMLTVYLVQRGSAESKDPEAESENDDDPRTYQFDPDAPWPVRRGGVWLSLYENSLFVAFVVFLEITGQVVIGADQRIGVADG